MKKKLLILLLGAALLLSFTACQNKEQESSAPSSENSVTADFFLPESSSQASSQAPTPSPTPTSTPAAESESSASEETGDSSSEISDSGETEVNLLPDITTNSADFKTKFLGNPIDAAFNNDISLAASLSKMVEVTNAAAASWESAADSAYAIALDSCATDADTLKVKTAQIDWVKELTATLDNIRDKGDDSFDTAINILQVYRAHAAVLLEMAYENSGSYAFPE